MCSLGYVPDMGSSTWKCISIQIQIHLSFKIQMQILFPPKYLNTNTNTLKSISNTNTFFISTAFQTVMLKREMYNKKHNFN